LDQVRFHADFEQQQDRADFGYDPQHGIGSKGFECGYAEQAKVSQQHTHQQLAQNRRLSDSSQQLASDFGGRDDQRQDQERLAHSFADVGVWRQSAASP
jgi:hypothetical protein